MSIFFKLKLLTYILYLDLCFFDVPLETNSITQNHEKFESIFMRITFNLDYYKFTFYLS